MTRSSAELAGMNCMVAPETTDLMAGIKTMRYSEVLDKTISLAELEVIN